MFLAHLSKDLEADRISLLLPRLLMIASLYLRLPWVLREQRQQLWTSSLEALLKIGRENQIAGSATWIEEAIAALNGVSCFQPPRALWHSSSELATLKFGGSNYGAGLSDRT